MGFKVIYLDKVGRWRWLRIVLQSLAIVIGVIFLISLCGGRARQVLPTRTPAADRVFSWQFPTVLPTFTPGLPTSTPAMSVIPVSTSAPTSTPALAPGWSFRAAAGGLTPVPTSTPIVFPSPWLAATPTLTFSMPLVTSTVVYGDGGEAGGWYALTVQEQDTGGYWSGLRVWVCGKSGLLTYVVGADRSWETWAFTGSKVELGQYAAEFTPLKAWTYVVEPQGLPLSYQVDISEGKFKDIVFHKVGSARCH